MEWSAVGFPGTGSPSCRTVVISNCSKAVTQRPSSLITRNGDEFERQDLDPVVFVPLLSGQA